MLAGLESLSSDELFELHQEMQSVIREKLMAKRLLESLWPQINQQSEIRSKNARTGLALPVERAGR